MSSTSRRPLGTGTEAPAPARDPRSLTAAERAVEGEWVEVPDRADRPAAESRRRLGPRGR